MILFNIAQLFCISKEYATCKKGTEMADAVCMTDAFVVIKGEKIAAIGEMRNFSPAQYPDETFIDCAGRLVFPGFVDSHTHLIFPKTREEEYLYKIQGMTYEDIAKKGGGILNSARALADMSESALLESALKRAQQILRTGTTTVEIKSGYGLSVEGEIKMLRVARQLQTLVPQTIRTTFLGAHALPPIYKTEREKYISLITEEMIPQIAEEKLADFIDVFCETNFFTAKETEIILQKGADYQIPAKIHANQLDFSEGVKTGVKMGAVSVDHLERITDEDIAALQASDTVPTLLPSCSFFLREPFGPARKLIAAGLPLCLATDFNPGSSPSGSMPFVWALACTYLRMLPEEALCAMTLNGANALRLSGLLGSIEVGKQADLIITHPMSHLAKIPYSFTENPVYQVIVKGATQLSVD